MTLRFMHTLADKAGQCEVFTQLPALKTQITVETDHIKKVEETNAGNFSSYLRGV